MPAESRGWQPGPAPVRAGADPVSLGKPDRTPPQAFDPWAPPAEPTDTVPSGWGSAPAPHPVHDGPTVTSVPGAPGPGTPGAWDNPFAPPPQSAFPGGPTPGPPGAPGDPFAPPAAHTPYPQPAPGEPVPPPPISPDGPGRFPYDHAHYAPAPPHGSYQGFPGYGWPGTPAPSNGMGTAGLVLGIIAAAVFCLWPLAIVLGVLGVIFGAIGRRKARRGEATNPGQALAGIICGAVGIALGIAMLVFLIVTPDDDGDGGPGGDGGFSTSLVSERSR
ncbi:DUF4190 domain-containing protein [Streptomyces sp. 142MFCol3.1]|uniref:DUF4190 domain-containing protein n=1 Tax=Streptomyces sp. 142MFCol3.1 TaxID=1172179 RepID=UPI0018F87FA2|nr:DUF4190 domain-containing protein [Streptomyces sp. 142MFCol3.1]